MSFRRNVFDSFNDNFDGYSRYAHAEDTDFSCRISRKYELIVAISKNGASPESYCPNEPTTIHPTYDFESVLFPF